MTYTWSQLGFIMILYSFLGWCAETIVYAIRERKIVSVSFLTFPLLLTHGIVMVNLVLALPSFGEDRLSQFVMTLIVSAVIHRLSTFNMHRLCPKVVWPKRSSIFVGRWMGFPSILLFAAIYFLVFQIFHPLVIFLMTLIPLLVIDIVTAVLQVWIIMDMVFVIVSVRRGEYAEDTELRTRFAKRLTDALWRRIHKTFPGVRTMNAEEEREAYTFARGMTLDKIIWVFLISALVGDVIETFWVRLVSNIWMNRSSLIYGPFSLVWGLGAVMLTIVLSPLKSKNDRWVFFGGFFIGGAYEYLCSLFTEIVFGTVFWDYSDMPLNINGRTNVLFMFFWGVLSVVWVKLFYPWMSSVIEKIPPVVGKLVTWVVAATMLLNCALTMMAMMRYNVRREDPVPHTLYDSFIDSQYPDAFIERRWSNMRIVDENGITLVGDLKKSEK